MEKRRVAFQSGEIRNSDQPENLVRPDKERRLVCRIFFRQAKLENDQK